MHARGGEGCMCMRWSFMFADVAGLDCGEHEVGGACLTLSAEHNIVRVLNTASLL